MEKVQKLSKSIEVSTARELGAKLVYGLLTLLILWCSGDASGEIFWSRLPFLTLFTMIGIGLWMFFTHSELWKTTIIVPNTNELRKSLGFALVSLVPALILVAILVNFLGDSPWVSWEFLKSFNVFTHIYALLFLAISSYLVEFYFRSYLSVSWGRGNVAFLESITIAVALQHFLPFVLLLPMIYFLEHLTKKHGIKIAALTRTFWTLGIALILSLFA